MFCTKKLRLFAGCMSLWACADSIQKEIESEKHDAASKVADAGDGPSDDLYRIVSLVVDASDPTTAVYLDLDTGKQVGQAEGWDLSFKRFHVQMNGGVSGELAVQARTVDEDFESLHDVPEEGFSSDVADGPEDSDRDADNLFNNWYDYDLTDHTLLSKKLSYVVLTSDASAFKLIIDDYYDAAGSPAILSVRYARLSGATPTVVTDAGVDATMVLPDASEQVDASATGDAPVANALTVSATSASEWVYIDLAGTLVTPADPAHSTAWALAFKRTEVRTNSGSSGQGLGGAKLEERALSFEQIEAANTFGFAVDEPLGSGAPGATPSSQNPVLAGWYDYKPDTHAVTAGERCYIVRAADGSLAKLRILSFQGGVFTLRLEPITTLRELRELDVDATLGEAWAYVSLRAGALVTVTEPASDGKWDVAISRTRFRTNGGSSGAGMGAAQEASTSELAGLSAVTGAFVADALVSSGQPGSAPVSGNPVLSNWYDYDLITHVVSPRAKVFVVRTADGQLGAFKVVTYSGGAYRLLLSYAGAGASGF